MLNHRKQHGTKKELETTESGTIAEPYFYLNAAEVSFFQRFILFTPSNDVGCEYGANPMPTQRETMYCSRYTSQRDKLLFSSSHVLDSTYYDVSTTSMVLGNMNTVV